MPAVVGSSPHPKRLGRYEVVSLLAQGGMAELYLAHLPGIEGFAKRVVIKRVLPSLARDRQFIDMFLGEARLAALLHHQNIVQVHDIGQDEAGYFFTMEYLHGADVGELMRVVEGALPLSIALEIARGACAGLHYAHERRGPDGSPLGIVHRDVSPQNLFVTFEGNVKLLDFGIAKAVHQISSHYTRSGTVRGKLPYMSPEQCQGEAIDRRSDVFSLSVVLWEMTVGRRLFGANAQSDFEILKAVVEQDAPRPSSIVASYPPALERIVMKGLARDRAARYQSADELQSELEGFMRGSNEWVTSREVAAFVRERFGDRAAASLRLDKEEITAAAAENNVVPFPNTRPLAPETAPTVDLPLPAKTPAVEKVGPAKRSAMWIVLGGVALAGVAGLVGYLLHRGGTTPAATPAATSTATPAAEDADWFVKGDYLVHAGELQNGRTPDLFVAKMLEPADSHGKAKFLLGDGREIVTSVFFATHIPRPDELHIGDLAFCYQSRHASKSIPPESKVESRTAPWSAGKLTDLADLGSGLVMVASDPCVLGGLRVVDR